MAAAETIGRRVQAARRAARVKSAGELARRVLAVTGYSVTRQTIANLERDMTTPRAELLEALAQTLAIPLDELRYGPRGEDAFALVQLRALSPDLEDHQWERLLWLANDMAEETRRKRITPESLSEAELRLIAAYRAATPDAQPAILEAAGAQPPSEPETESASPPVPKGRRRPGKAS